VDAADAGGSSSAFRFFESLASAVVAVAVDFNNGLNGAGNIAACSFTPLVGGARTAHAACAVATVVVATVLFVSSTCAIGAADLFLLLLALFVG